MKNKFFKTLFIVCLMSCLVGFLAESSQWIKPPSSYKIENLRIDGSILKFDIKVKALASSAEGRFNQCCKIIKMKKLDITDAQFETRYRP